MPASAAQVFGPTTVDPGFTTTGEKTLLTMNTTLPSGGINVIVCAIAWNATTDTGARGTFRIYKGTTLLYETYSTQAPNVGGTRARPVMIFAVDSSPAGNDTYYLKINITTAGSATCSIHVQGIVIKTNDAAWGYNSTGVSIASGATATVTTLSTSFPSGAKVAILAATYFYPSTTGAQLVGAGNVKLKSGTTVVSSNQFNTGGWSTDQPCWVNLIYLETTSSSSQSYSVEITNGSASAYTAYAMIVAFSVAAGAFLDTASVALTSGSQVTVGSLSTTLSGNVVVIGLAAAENTGTAGVTAFNANDVVLQLNNSATEQISNLVGWIFEATSGQGRSGILPLFRLDTNVTNPSYQIKMTARASGLNGEAKILAFTISITVSVSDSGSGVELITVNVPAFISDAGELAEVVDMIKETKDFGNGIEAIDMAKELLDSGTGYDYFTGGLYKTVDDSGAGSELVGMSKESTDSGSGTELVNMLYEALDSGSGVDSIFSPRYNPLTDSGIGAEVPTVGVTQNDAGAGAETSAVIGTIPAIDSGLGIDTVTQMVKMVIDSGAVVEAVYISARVFAFDSGAGADVIGVITYIPFEDFGKGEELADLFLSIYGMVLVDNEQVGIHSIPYKDWKKNNIPVQVHRRSVGDKVYIDDDDIGYVVVEWEDKVSDVVPGERTVIVTGVVELYD
jgi:hypothetical protein